ncbi:restriction endonuclease [Priestia filamentosa]|uniref:restriction endonuclease n=1 Tax=Priestia filamentosa TaxID=1402861 RepID=UPI003F150721
MFDYTNLSPHEFEVLCADILSRELNITLRCFSPGRDGGIDHLIFNKIREVNLSYFELCLI